MSEAESSEARELSLVDKVELKIALAQSDTALQSILQTYLPPLILKLASEYISVRNKVRICLVVKRALFKMLETPPPVIGPMTFG